MDYLKESSENQFKEIDLFDFIKVIKKGKKMIFVLFLIGLISGVFWYFLAPSSYQGTIIFKIGESENIREIVEGFKKGIYNDYPKLEVINPSGTNLIEVNITTKEQAQAKILLEEIKTDILSIHNQKADSKKQAITQEISFLEKTIENFKKDISDSLAKGEPTTSLKLEIYRIEKNINDLEKEKNNISMTAVVKEPNVREERPGYLSIFFAAVLGFFVGLILASFSEWLEENKQRI